MVVMMGMQDYMVVEVDMVTASLHQDTEEVASLLVEVTPRYMLGVELEILLG